MPSTHRRTTAQDVADVAGVSRSAVSLVLNGRAGGMVSAAKQETVLAAARQLGYRPNTVALSLRSQRSWTVGVLTWAGIGRFPQALLHPALRSARRAGYLTITMDVAGGVDHFSDALERLADRQIDGLVVVAPMLTEVSFPSEVRTPTVMINCTDSTGAATSVVPDELGAGRSAAGLLIEAGHSRIAILADDAATLQSRRRVAGALQAVVEAGLPQPIVEFSAPTARAAYPVARALLSRPDAPTAVVATRERLALGAQSAARDLGRCLADADWLVSLDDGEGIAWDLEPRIPMVERPDQAISEKAVSLLLQAIECPESSPVRQLSFTCPLRR